MATVAVANQKGGVGRTTLALRLAAAAAHPRRPVLGVDLDPQANPTTGLGLWGPERTVDDALAADEPGVLRRVIVPSAWPNGQGTVPDVAPSTPALAAREPQLVTDPVGAQDRLHTALSGVDYDLVVI